MYSCHSSQERPQSTGKNTEHCLEGYTAMIGLYHKLLVCQKPPCQTPLCSEFPVQ